MNASFRFLTGFCLITSFSVAHADFSETGGEVALEAEHYHATNIPGATNDSWIPVCGSGGTFSGESSLLAGPDDGDLVAGPAETVPGDPINDSPRLSYNINFSTPGTYTVWLKGFRTGAAGDSVHVGLDNTFRGTVLIPGSVDFVWSNLNVSPGGASPLQFFASAGLHTLDIWMREDGIYIDKIFLTSTGTTDPTVTEPVAGNPIQSGAGVPPAAAPQITPNGGSIAASSTVELSTCTPGASIFFTTNGTDPTTGSTLYSTPFVIPTLPAEVRAIASVSPGVTRTDSAISSANFTQNQDPVVDSPISSQNATEGVPFNLDVSGNFSDPDGDTLTFGMSGLPAGTGLGIDSVTGVISGTPTQADVDASPIVVSVTASDGKGGSDAEEFFALTVADANSDPVPDPGNQVGPQTGTQGGNFNLDVSGAFNDPDGDPLTYSMSGLPAGTGLSIDPNTGVISGVPTEADANASPITVVVTASDGMGGTDAQISFELTIQQGGGSDDLTVDFGSAGLWTYLNDSNWLLLNSGSPLRTVTGDIDDSGQDDVIADFGSAGIWAYRNLTSWTQLNSGTTEQLAVGDLDGNGNDDVIADFGAAGLWVYLNDSNWVQLNGGSPEQVVTADVDGNGQDDVIADFGVSGVWIKLNQGGWTQLNIIDSEMMAVGDLDNNDKDDVVIDFGAAGLWAYMNGSSWLKILSSSPDLIATGDLDGNGADDILASFESTGAGLWQKLNLGAWSKLNTNAPDRMITADVDGSGKDDIIATFTSTAAGIFIKRNQAAWVLLNAQTAEELGSGQLDGQ